MSLETIEPIFDASGPGIIVDIVRALPLHVGTRCDEPNLSARCGITRRQHYAQVVARASSLIRMRLSKL